MGNVNSMFQRMAKQLFARKQLDNGEITYVKRGGAITHLKRREAPTLQILHESLELPRGYQGNICSQRDLPKVGIDLINLALDYFQSRAKDFVASNDPGLNFQRRFSRDYFTNIYPNLKTSDRRDLMNHARKELIDLYSRLTNPTQHFAEIIILFKRISDKETNSRFGLDLPIPRNHLEETIVEQIKSHKLSREELEKLLPRYSVPDREESLYIEKEIFHFLSQDPHKANAGFAAQVRRRKIELKDQGSFAVLDILTPYYLGLIESLAPAEQNMLSLFFDGEVHGYKYLCSETGKEHGSVCTALQRLISKGFLKQVDGRAKFKINEQDPTFLEWAKMRSSVPIFNN